MANGQTSGLAATYPSRGTGFFAHHGLWAPGVRLFRSVSFSKKAWIISVVFALPLVLLAYNYFSDKAATIEFSSQERLGVEFAQAAFPVLHAMQQDRLNAMRRVTGEPAAAAPPVDAALTRLRELNAKLGPTLGTKKQADALETAVQQTAQAPLTRDGQFAAHTQRIQALVDLLNAATDGSNLTLDPDIDTYYLMDAALFRLPAILEGLAQLRGQGYAALRQSALSPAQARQVMEQVYNVNAQLAALEAGLDKALNYNGTLKDGVKHNEAAQSTKRFIADVEKGLLALDRSAPPGRCSFAC